MEERQPRVASEYPGFEGFCMLNGYLFEKPATVDVLAVVLENRLDYEKANFNRDQGCWPLTST
jgi:hypothetical protein